MLGLKVLVLTFFSPDHNAIILQLPITKQKLIDPVSEQNQPVLAHHELQSTTNEIMCTSAAH